MKKEELDIKRFFEEAGIEEIDFVSKSEKKKFINISFCSGDILIISRLQEIKGNYSFRIYVDISGEKKLYIEEVENILKAMKLLQNNYKNWLFVEGM